MKAAGKSGGLFCAPRVRHLGTVPLWNWCVKLAIHPSRNGQQIITTGVMETRITFGRKNVGHPFRAGFAPHVLQPLAACVGLGIAQVRRVHAFRAALPKAMLRVMPEHEPEVAQAMERARLRSKPVNPGMITAQDVKDFLLAYCACFLAVLAFIS